MNVRPRSPFFLAHAAAAGAALVLLAGCPSEPGHGGPPPANAAAPPAAVSSPNPTATATATKEAKEMRKVPTTDAEWRAKLTPLQYHVTREKGTERAFTGEYWNCHDEGVYRCIGCGEVLFRSEAKYDSGCGWPSFSQSASKEAVATAPDKTHGMVRTEITCKRCGAHLGHVFEDGPAPTGLRYCVNSASVDLEKSKPAK